DGLEERFLNRCGVNKGVGERLGNVKENRLDIYEGRCAAGGFQLEKVGSWGFGENRGGGCFVEGFGEGRLRVWYRVNAEGGWDNVEREV
ncbi:hypothetical protein, partial [Bacillus altitudinis]|uniref:hypothetical protein n=1 Tax=Bacillus altitudinis TaxID=293387 RepID=UPI001C92BA78